ncbi:MAG: calcium/sodium antiporter [Candidatus Woesearchaeota archaeon]
MIIEYVLFILGFVLLVKGADWLVEGSSALAKRYGVSSLMIGLTIVSFGTSAPELLVNVFAALKGNSDVALGNIIGSNLMNLLLGLGIVAVIDHVRAKHSITWREIPFALLSVILLLILINKNNILSIFNISDGSVNTLSIADGIIMLLFFSAFLYYLYYAAKAERNKDQEQIKIFGNLKTVIYIIVGIAGLYFGGDLVVDGAVFIAKQFGLSEFLISVTIIAIGTSLPEIVTAVTAALKKDTDMSVGTIVGTNIFNILFVLGITALISPISAPYFINFDLIILLIATALLFAFMFIGRKHTLDRWEGIVYIIIYAIYLYIIIKRG